MRGRSWCAPRPWGSCTYRGAAAAGQQVRLVEHGRPGLLSDGVTLAVYRVVQESLTNALKHAPFSPVTVCLRYSDSSVDVEVTTGAVDRAPGGALVPAGRRARRAASGRRGGRRGLPRSRPHPGTGVSEAADRAVWVLVPDDQALVRTGFATIVGAQEDLEVVGEASDGRSAVEFGRRVRPDVVDGHPDARPGRHRGRRLSTADPVHAARRGGPLHAWTVRRTGRGVVAVVVAVMPKLCWPGRARSGPGTGRGWRSAARPSPAASR